jgi:hypothetical protein
VQLDALTRGAVLSRATAGSAALGLDPAPPLKARQVPEIRVGDRRNVPTRAAVASVGTALRDVLLPPEAERTVAAAPGLHPEPRAVVEH